MNKREITIRRALYFLQQFAVFFLVFGFVITCCMLLFLHAAYSASGFEFTREEITPAAKMTFVNIFVLSLIGALVDEARRYFMVQRPVARIAKAAERVMQGDLSARIARTHMGGAYDGYNVVIDYFNHMAEELSGMETLRTDFIANVSHELKTPLAVIQNYAMMLQQPGLSEAKRIEYAKTITDASRNLANMVTNILKLNKLENQKIYPDTKVYDLGEQLCECLLAFEEVWEKKKIEIETDIAENIRVNADPELLSLAWNNLISNAMKFTESGGTVAVFLRREGSQAVVQVRDTGCGIPPEVGKHIFEKFYQGDTSHATKGNGLGLALVRRVIDITGGEIEVDSRVGRGSTFTVKLEVHTSEAKRTDNSNL